jgi:hypothetical protein
LSIGIVIIVVISILDIIKEIKEVIVKDNWKEKLKELLIKQGLSPDDPEDEASQQIWCEQENFISSLLSSQLKDVLGVIESKKPKCPEHGKHYEPLCGRCYNADLTIITLDDIKAELTQLAGGEEEK